MDSELLQSISLAVAEARTVDTVLKMIVSGLHEKAGFALARIWLLGDGDICNECRMRPECPSQARCLHLVASAGQSLVDGRQWSRIDGSFRRFPLGVRKIGRVGLTGESVLFEADGANPTSMSAVGPEWAQTEGIQAFAGHPLVFRGEILGVLGVFRREPVGKQLFDWLRLFANQAAVAIANARAFEEINSLRERLELENEYLRTEIKENFGGLWGQSGPLQRILQQIELVAPTEASVLILGESGTGKELIARAIHDRSARANRPLVKVNCASIPRELFESEFFGHVKGAFTGALRDRVGRFQLADGGSLFLDEVGEIPIELQGKLLRVLQEAEFERVGEDRTRRANVRIIAATNRNLGNEVEAGRFRADLYFRLSVFPLEAQPLRERQEDIPILAAHFIRQAASRLNCPPPPLSEASARDLCRYSWPGNIRELQHVIERDVILSRGAALHFDLRERPGAGATQLPALPRPPFTRKQLVELERQSIQEALRKRALERFMDRVALPNCWVCVQRRSLRRSRPWDSNDIRLTRSGQLARATGLCHKWEATQRNPASPSKLASDYNISVPAAVSVFPEEVYLAPRSWTERAYHNLIHFNALAKGGHFAAWEQPQLFSEEVRAGFRSLRK